ncbi:protein C9orf135-like [Hypomesus transpacificus]|uniref:protein C9orf135-like n=1 Tax=Hypomesus transpacificus TaxID=137520 RepID=UPI001F074679|nr:protein C9orf135-like [Hypomesus transpacificus]XP_046871733.1 protein C9orf135-like [Hypomesus transpacificus]
MSYSRRTLISDWHKHREAEPKDYDFTQCPAGQIKTLSKSTYKHLGTMMDADWTTSTGAQMAQSPLEEKNQARGSPRSMVTAEHFQSAHFNMRTLPSKDAAGLVTNDVLPRHPPGHNQIELVSTYNVDYLPPYGAIKEEVSVERQAEETPDFRRRQSQFTDTADYRRAGRNTWQEESGVYLSPGSRSGVHTRPTNPFLP